MVPQKCLPIIVECMNNHKGLSVAFASVLVLVLLIVVIGMVLNHRDPMLLQGEVEATEIRVSGKLLGRIDSFLVSEGDDVKRGDTLVVINSPLVQARYRQADAMRQVAEEQNRKIDSGTRTQIIASSYQLWQAAKSQTELAEKTYTRVHVLFHDSVVPQQRFDEALAALETARAAERGAYEQYRLMRDGAQEEDKVSAQKMVEVAQSSVEEVAALLVDAKLTAPADGQIADIFPKRGELVAPGAPVMNLVVLKDCHAVFNIREDLLPHFRVGRRFVANIPALARDDVPFEVYYISPLGSFATWKSTKQVGSYDMRTFTVKMRPTQEVEGLRPGMAVLLEMTVTDR